MRNHDNLVIFTNVKDTSDEKLQIKIISFEKQKDGHLIQTHLDIAYNDNVVSNTWHSINGGSLN